MTRLSRSLVLLGRRLAILSARPWAGQREGFTKAFTYCPRIEQGLGLLPTLYA